MEPSPDQERAWQSSFAKLRETIASARQRHWDVVAVVFPVEMQLGEEAAELYRRALGLRVAPGALSGEPQQRLTAFFADEGVPVVDLLPAFRAHRSEPLFLRNVAISHDPVHPSEVGHRVAASEIAPVLAAGFKGGRR
jgi:hypothetical protein